MGGYTHTRAYSHTQMDGEDTSCIAAAKSGDLELVITLLDAGADDDAVDEQSKSAGWWASANGHLAVVRHLRSRGADMNIRDTRLGFTPFLGVCRRAAESTMCIASLTPVPIHTPNDVLA